MNRRHRVALDSLRVLDAIARQGSFAAAAQELCVVTSAVTHTVKNLEEDLGLTLFDRSGRKARFTREGSLLLESGRALLDAAAGFDAEARRIATGWEPVLTLSLDQVIRSEPLVPLVGEFFAVAPQTAVAIKREAAAGSWDALLSGRADLVVGAPAEGPPGGGYETALLHEIDFVAAVAPGHALAREKGVISDAELARHRSVVVGDTARSLPRLAYGLQDSPARLAVPDTAMKLAAILAGLGCGFLPRGLAQPHVRAGRLVTIRVATPHPPSRSNLAWRAGANGRALRWWIAALLRPAVARHLYH